MRQTLYRYNEETCQYERIRTKPGDIIVYGGGVFLAALLFLAAMLALHDLVIDSEKELTLRKENAAFEKNQVILTSQLNGIEETLVSLSEEDQKLHEKFFGSALTLEPVKKSKIANRNLLLADPSAFREVAGKVEHQSGELLKRSTITNSYFSNIALEKKEKERIVAMPTLQPVRQWHSEKVISGMGMRVNPFHKGLYEHPGIDISIPRGTDVIATASGTITEIKRSDLQAGYGNYIEIDHGNGFATRYAHLDEIKVRFGQRVDKGFIIGISGSSGGSIAPHLHYEIIKDGKNVNPVIYMFEGLSSEEHNNLKHLSEKKNQSLD